MTRALTHLASRIYWDKIVVLAGSSCSWEEAAVDLREPLMRDAAAFGVSIGFIY